MDYNKISKGVTGLTKSFLGLDKSDTSIQENRLNICYSCDKLIKVNVAGRTTNKCDACGCFISQKVKLKSEKCPLNKW